MAIGFDKASAFTESALALLNWPYEQTISGQAKPSLTQTGSLSKPMAVLSRSAKLLFPGLPMALMKRPSALIKRASALTESALALLNWPLALTE